MGVSINRIKKCGRNGEEVEAHAGKKSNLKDDINWVSAPERAVSEEIVVNSLLWDI